MTKLKLEDRKNTTANGVAALRELLYSFDFCKDIDKVVGLTFNAAADIGQTEIHYSDRAEIRICNGNADIYAWVDEYGYLPEQIYNPWDIIKIDFEGVLKSLQDAIQKYNDKVAEKNKDIEKLLAVCAQFKNQP